jgi:hypothetical protein
MSAGIQMTRVPRTVTSPGYWAARYIEHPDEKPDGAPDPQAEPGKFSQWAEHNLPVVTRMKEASE